MHPESCYQLSSEGTEPKWTVIGGYRANLSVRKWAKAPACLFVLKFKKMRPDVPCAFLNFKKMRLDVPCAFLKI